MRTEFQNDTLTIFLEGRIDSNNAESTDSQITEAISQNPEGCNIQIDAERLEYISSAGLRVLLKLRKRIKTPLPILNVSNDVYDVFNVTGFTELLDVRRKMREVSVEGCEVLGEGANGKVYRLTRDEMIKVFKHGISLSDIEAEREASRKAFLLGVPCAIAFDTVKCGESYGTIYETLNARTLTERINDDPECLPGLAESSGLLLRQLHSTEIPEGQMPKASRLLHSTIDKLTGDFTPDEIAKMHALYDAIPEGNRFIHNDYHTKNIMESNGELMLIDLGDAGMGNPVIDLIHCYMVFELIGKGTRNVSDDDISFIGIRYRDMYRFWDILIDTYCNGDKERVASLTAKLEPYANLMYLSVAMAHPLMPKEYRKPYAEKMRSMILPRYDELLRFSWEM